MALLALSGVARCHAGLIQYEPNNTPSKAAALAPGQWLIQDDLNGNAGRPDTLLAEFNPAYSAWARIDDNGNPAPNQKGSQLLNVNLLKSGAAYFRVTGTGDSKFDGAHSQTGRYSVKFEIRDPLGLLVKTLPLVFEDINKNMVDNVWIDPDNSKPSWLGYTVDVTVNNIVGAGSGDSLDYWIFTGLQPGQAFTAKITSAMFQPLLGVLNSSNALTGISNPAATLPTISGTADAQGRVRIGVTAANDLQFKGEHAEVGQYTLEVVPVIVPEPSGTLLAILGGMIACALWRRRRARR